MATADVIKTYNRVDYDRIKKEGFTFILPPETLAAIKSIAQNVGAPEYIKTPHFERRVNNKPRLILKEISDTEWDSIRKFKATVLEKKKGVEMSIDTIRKHLNKMTDKTYDNLKNKIKDEIDLILRETSDNTELASELSRIGDAVFDIASGNSFYSKMYATLYKELMSNYTFMHTIFTTNVNTESSIFKDFAYCDPNKDYDQFCNNNKTNEKRRALALFYVNLMLQQIIPASKIAELLDELQTEMLQYIKNEGNVNIVEEMSELISILAINGLTSLKQLTDEWTQIVGRVKYISGLKAKSEPSISNKTIFKFMDIHALISI